MTDGSLSANAVAGAALASLELHRVMISLLMQHGILPVDLTLAMIDTALEATEKWDAALQAGSRLDEAAQWRAARFHIASLLVQYRALRDRLASQRDPRSNLDRKTP